MTNLPLADLILCDPCSHAAGNDGPIYHRPPACPGDGPLVSAGFLAPSPEDAPTPTMEQMDALLDRVVEIEGSFDKWHHEFREAIASLIRASRLVAPGGPEVTDAERDLAIDAAWSEVFCAVDLCGDKRVERAIKVLYNRLVPTPAGLRDLSENDRKTDEEVVAGLSARQLEIAHDVYSALMRDPQLLEKAAKGKI